MDLTNLLLPLLNIAAFEPLGLATDITAILPEFTRWYNETFLTLVYNRVCPGNTLIVNGKPFEELNDVTCKDKMEALLGRPILTDDFEQAMAFVEILNEEWLEGKSRAMFGTALGNSNPDSIN